MDSSRAKKSFTGRVGKSLLILLLSFAVHALARAGEAYAWRTFTGKPGGPGNADGPASTSRFYYPSGVATDGAGNIYVADTFNNTIRKIDVHGVVTILAGSPGQVGGSDGVGNAARFSSPASIVADNSGNLFVTDADNSTIRRISSGGVVTTIAGTAGETGIDDGIGSAARFSYPLGVALDNAGNLYIADSGNSTIRKIFTNGTVTTLAGTAGRYGSNDGTTTNAQFYYPSGVAVDGAGNVFVADQSNETIRKITPAGVVTTIAGNVGQSGSADGPNTNATFNYPASLAVDGAGNIYVADSFNSTIRKITSAGAVTTLAGNASTTGNSDGTGQTAQFNYPEGLTVDGAGNVLVADTYNSSIRIVSPAGLVATIAGSPDRSGTADATGSVARFNTPYSVAADAAGYLYVADSHNDTIRRVSPGGLVSTIAGSAGQVGTNDGIGNLARFNIPYGVAVNGAGTVFIADTSNNTIRKQDPNGQITTLAGSPGQSGSADGTNNLARFSGPIGLAVDNFNNIFVADFYNNTIRKITVDGVVSTVAGSPGQSGTADGTNTTARFNSPFCLALDGSGNLFVSDAGNNTIRKVTANGAVTTAAGSPGQPGSTDGVGGAARFFYPAGLAVDNLGNVFIADVGNSTIRKMAADGTVTTIAGAPGLTGTTDGIGSAARFSYPVGMGSDSNGFLYVTDSGTHLIRKVTPAGFVITLAGGPGQAGSQDVSADMARFFQPSGVAVDPVGNIYVADTYNDAIRMVGRDRTVKTIAGLPGEPGSMDGKTAARFSHPLGLAVDAQFNVYVADSINNTIRKITTDSVVTTIAGSAGIPGSTDGTGAAARFSSPSGLAIDTNGFIYVTDAYNSTIRKMTPDGTVITLAGTATLIGSVDGIGNAARFNHPNGVVANSSGNLYIADSGNSTLRKISPSGVVTTIAGSPGQAGSDDGVGSNARFDYPAGLTIDSQGNVYVADPGNSTIRKVTSDGTVTTIGGLDGVFGASDGLGGAAIFAAPGGIAVDADGRFYVADAGNNRISRGLRLPTLNISGGSAGATVSWPSLTSSAFSLQQSSYHNSPSDWAAWTGQIGNDGTNKTIVLSPLLENQFFRLISD
jgi:sugar lactone lactonase YvrE